MNQKRLEELLERIRDGNEELVDVEYIGKFLVNGNLTLRVPSRGLEHRWAASMVPIEYMPVYGLKCDRPEMAGGLLEAAPFARFDATSPEHEWLNLPTQPEELFELCTDQCGAQFWVGQSSTVYGHNLDNEFQPIGTLSDFVDFAIEMALQERSWHQCLGDANALKSAGLVAINTMG